MEFSAIMSSSKGEESAHRELSNTITENILRAPKYITPDTTEVAIAQEFGELEEDLAKQ